MNPLRQFERRPRDTSVAGDWTRPKWNGARRRVLRAVRATWFLLHGPCPVRYIETPCADPRCVTLCEHCDPAWRLANGYD